MPFRFFSPSLSFSPGMGEPRLSSPPVPASLRALAEPGRAWRSRKGGDRLRNYICF